MSNLSDEVLTMKIKK